MRAVGVRVKRSPGSAEVLLEYSRQIAFLEELPLTAAGKVRRRDVRERERLERPRGWD